MLLVPQGKKPSGMQQRLRACFGSVDANKTRTRSPGTAWPPQRRSGRLFVGESLAGCSWPSLSGPLSPHISLLTILFPKVSRESRFVALISLFPLRRWSSLRTCLQTMLLLYGIVWTMCSATCAPGHRSSVPWVLPLASFLPVSLLCLLFSPILRDPSLLRCWSCLRTDKELHGLHRARTR